MVKWEGDLSGMTAKEKSTADTNSALRDSAEQEGGGEGVRDVCEVGGLFH